MAEQAKLVDCKDCPFERRVDIENTVNPTDILFHHGRQTGHKLRVLLIER